MNKTTESSAKTTLAVAKPVLDVKALVLPKEIKIEIMKTCTVIRNANGNKWYLKGKTLEITHFIPALKSRLERFSDDVIAKCHLGYVTCKMAVSDTADLQDVLAKHFANSPTIKKQTPAVKQTAKVVEKKPVAKTAKKTTKQIVPVTPAPAAANDQTPTVAAVA